MSEAMMDERPRMREYMKPEDMNLQGCLKLAATVLSEQGEALTEAARRAAACPSAENLKHLKTLREFYETDLFTAYSCGVIDGRTAANAIIKKALSGREVRV